MIPISYKEYYLKGVKKDFFWKEFDNVTAGQYINPEFSYTTPHYANFENKFAGRKTKDNFSVYLFRPISREFRTEILAKGTVIKNKKGIIVKTKFEIPSWSILMLLIFGVIILGPIYLISIISGAIFTFIGIFIYSLVLFNNYKNIKSELSTQFEIIQSKKSTNS